LICCNIYTIYNVKNRDFFWHILFKTLSVRGDSYASVVNRKGDTIIMKKLLMRSNLFLKVCAFLVVVAPLVDMSSRSAWGWGEPEYPNEEDFA